MGLLEFALAEAEHLAARSHGLMEAAVHAPGIAGADLAHIIQNHQYVKATLAGVHMAQIAVADARQVPFVTALPYANSLPLIAAALDGIQTFLAGLYASIPDTPAVVAEAAPKEVTL